jgi:hypothetical protein
MATIQELESRIVAIENHLIKLPAGSVRFVPGEKPTLYQEVTADLNREQLVALENAGLTTVAQLKQAAGTEDGFTKIDGLGKVADRKIRAALEGLTNGR